jgi:type II secretory pathway pseudopilin PulG
VVIAILGLLSAIVMVSTNSAREKAKASNVLSNQTQLQKAVELYFSDMGFYPPDVDPGWDPGFARRLPWKVNGTSAQNCNGNEGLCGGHNGCAGAIDNCVYMPANWMDVLEDNWNGPYANWPDTTPFGGDYDYNLFLISGNNFPPPCTVPPGVYVGAAQVNYDAQGSMSAVSEAWFLSNGLDYDYCTNGKVQLKLIGL